MLFRKILMVVVCFVIQSQVARADVFFHAGLDSQFVSNTYMDISGEWDIVEVPRASVELDFARYWAIGYSGRVEAYIRHPDLFFHGHEWYALINPAFGPDDRNSFLLMATLGVQKNTTVFERVNLLSPQLDMSLDLEPHRFLFWSTSLTTQYRWYYRNQVNSSLDVWAGTSLTFSLPSSTTIAPRVAFGYRYYTDPLVAPEEPFDIQIKPGIRLAQGVSENSGIWVDYEYLAVPNNNNLVMGEQQQAEMNYVGEDFLFSGHAIGLGTKRLWNNGWEGSLEFGYHQRQMAGLEVMDDFGVTTGEARNDQRITVGGGLHWEKEIDSESQALFSLGVQYEYLHQLSNDYWYATDCHTATLELAIDL